MLIRPGQTAPKKKGRLRAFFSRRPQVLVLLAALAIFAAGFWAALYTPAGKNFREGAASLRENLSRDKLDHYLAGRKAERRSLHLDISHKNFQWLAFKREEAFTRGIIVTDSDSYVNARATVDGKEYPVKIRLKGDYTDHLEGKKWSFRIKVRQGGKIWGMKSFSIQDPERSGWLKEWFFHRLLRHEGLIGLRYDFVDVIINGREHGLYALEESFGKELLEFNGRREAPILKFDESALIDEGLVTKGSSASQDDTYYMADVITFDTREVLEGETLKRNFELGRALLEKFRSGEGSVGEIFDLDRAARLFALTDILAVHHAMRWKNIRFAFNPVTAKLEAIGYNANGPFFEVYPVTSIIYLGWLAGKVGEHHVYDWTNRFFADEAFTRAYFSELERLSAPGYLESAVSAFADEMEAVQGRLYSDGPLEAMDLGQYYANRDTVRKIIRPDILPKVYLRAEESGGETIRLAVANTWYLPVEIEGLVCRARKGDAFTPSLSSLPPKKAKAPLAYSAVDFAVGGAYLQKCLGGRERVGDSVMLKDAYLAFRVPGTREGIAARIDETAMSTRAIPKVSRESVIARLGQLAADGIITVDDGEGTITVRRGDLTVDDDLVFPRGYRVVFGQEGTIDLVQGAAIISLSPVTLAGKEAGSLRLTSSDGTGQGLLVIGADGPSLLENLRIDGITAVDRGGWVTTGAVTFYESSVTMRNVTVSGIAAEDMLNVIRSEFEIRDSLFAASGSDAVDIDFGRGSIDDTRFEECTNDCLDVSGTEARFARLLVEGAGDKGISVGERSRVSVAESSITGADIAIAGKDDSQVDVRATTIGRCRVGLAAYRKKAEFGGGEIRAEDVTITGTTVPASADSFSIVAVDGKEQ